MATKYDNNTNELRAMMTDPTRVNHRVFVGCIPTDVMKPEELASMLAPYGEVEGALLNKGFGFVQFKSEEAAQAAVAANGRITFKGRKADVKPCRPMVPKRPFEAGGDNDGQPVQKQMGYLPDKGREPTRYPVNSGPRAPKYQVPPVPAVERTNDCEIIVVNKAQTEYAEYIEQKLRRLGLSVDLLFPNEDVPVARVLTNIANRGVLFAVVVMPTNEEHRSMTLNILHGPPQEHRNMPLEDAVELVSRSYESYILREKSARPVELPAMAPVGVPVAVAQSVGVPGAPFTPDRHPDVIQVLVNLLAENRMLTALQYDKIILYLQQRRQAQLKIELGDAAASGIPSPLLPLSSGLGADQQSILQSRILNILNKKNAPSAAPQATPAPSVVDVTSKPQLLQDPSVQKALNNLLQGDYLRKFAEKQ